MLVMKQAHMDLRNYLQQNHKRLTWAKKIKIIFDITLAILKIHLDENLIHRDLHSGNVLFNHLSQLFYISDLGFCGPADKPLNSIYGNLPYIAPEVISGKKLLVNLIFIVLVFLCGKFHLDNHLLLITNMIMILQ